MEYVNKTAFAIRLIEIWNASRTRQEAHLAIQNEMDENITYPQMMNKVTYAKRSGVEVKELDWDVTNWSKVRNHFVSDASDDDDNETFEIEG